MANMEIKDWKQFAVSELFYIHPTKNYNLTNAKLFDSVGNVPVVVNSSYNNGVGGYVNMEPTERGNIITFSDTTTYEAIFYQPIPFIGYSHVQGVYPLDEKLWNKNSMLFFLAAFRRAAKNYNFDYINKFTREIAQSIKVKLPVTSSGEIDYVFMESYIDKMEKQLESSVITIKKINHLTNNIIDVNSWKKFHIYDLFNIEQGSKLDKIYMKTENPSINFVGRSSANNGVTLRIDEIDDIRPFESGLLTVALGGEYLGSCFIQKDKFYTSQNVAVLIPKINMSTETKLFIATMIMKEGRTYYKAFIDELNKHIKTDFSFFLPVDIQGNIDYEFMNEYIKNIKIKSKLMVNYLKKIT